MSILKPERKKVILRSPDFSGKEWLSSMTLTVIFII